MSTYKNNNQDASFPTHIGIIMDGNGRWAKKRGLPRKMGHNMGAKNLKNITKYCSKIGIKYLSMFAFSTENWRRPQSEISHLMGIFKQYLESTISDFDADNIKIKFVGDISVFSEDIKNLVQKIEKKSQNNIGMALNIAMNYGGRAEITNAAKKIAQGVQEGKINLSDISEETFSDNLYTAGQPDIDLIIRPGGEYRISNFFLWQSAYAELIVMDVLWPDFKTYDLNHALEIYSSRNRRFGGI
jgi:undecaprenyl diphosphate synthase